MVGNGAGPGGDTVIDMPADQQEKKSLVWIIFLYCKHFNSYLLVKIKAN